MAECSVYFGGVLKNFLLLGNLSLFLRVVEGMLGLDEA